MTNPRPTRSRRRSRVMVLVFSASANASPQIRREVDMPSGSTSFFFDVYGYFQ